MNTIYHYCDLNGFLSIIKDKKLWVSAANNLNDYSEINWFIDKVHKKLNTIVTEENKEYLNEFWQYKTASSPMPYICSFSKNGDLLSQWRAYADNGHGIAIGFNRDYFNFFSTPGVLSSVHTNISDVIYSESQQNEHIDEVINLILSPFKNDEGKGMNFMNAVTFMDKYSRICKNEAFLEEDEVRIIHTPMIMGDKEGGTRIHGGISDLNYRVSAKTITSYFELDFSGEKKHNAILDIILGPKCQFSRFDIELFLSLHGFGHVPFRMSNASYR